MVTMLQREKHNKLTVVPDGDGLRFEGGVPVLTGELGVRLYDSYLEDAGRVAFRRKIEERSFDEQDMTHVAQFLMQRGIQPSGENCFRLVYGARMHLLFTTGS